MSDDILEIIELDLVRGLTDGGVDKDIAETIVGDRIRGIRESYGGVRYMIKRGYRRYSPEIVAEIRGRFNGRNAREIMAEFKVSRASLYRLVK